MGNNERIDYYDVLGVSRDASRDEIRKAYKKLAQKHHPDKHGGSDEAIERFKLIAEAWDVLSDTALRDQFDKTGSVDRNTQSIRVLASGQLAILFQQLLSDPTIDPMEQDLVLLVCGTIRSKQDQIKQELWNAKKKQNKIRLARSRVRYHGPEGDVFASVVDMMGGELEGRIEELRKSIEIGDVMLEMMEDYELIGQVDGQAGLGLDSLGWTPSG